MTTPHSRSRAAGFAGVLALLLAGAAFAQPASPGESARSQSWWAAFDLGLGQVHRSLPGNSNSKAQFYLSVSGGIELHPQVLVGAELSGWLGQSGDLNDPSKGSGIDQIFAVARLYPQANAPFHLVLGAGALTGWDNSPGSSYHHGTGWEAGVGYDLAMEKGRGAFTPFARLGGGKAGKLSLTTFTIGIGYTWR